jgi:capsular polysaccharide biosynthesis protein
MAQRIETQGQLSQFLEILFRRKWQILLPAMIILSLGISVAVIIPKRYLVRTQVEIRPITLTSASSQGDNAPFQIRARERIKKVLQDLKNPDYLALSSQKQFDFVTDMKEDVKVRLDKTPGGQGVFVNIEYIHSDVEWAVTFLKALREDWILAVVERDRRKVQDEADRLRTELVGLEREYKAEERSLSELMRRKNISATQPMPGGDDQRTEDPIFLRLITNQSLLDEGERRLAQLKERHRSLQERLRELPEKLTEQTLVEGVSNTEELQALDGQILEKERELSRYLPANTRYKKLQQEIRELVDQRETLKRQATKSALTSFARPNPQRAQLQDQIDMTALEIAQVEATNQQLQQAIVRDAQSVDDSYSVYREVRERGEKIKRLQATLEDASMRFQAKLEQARILDSPNSDPFVINEEVFPPLKPTEPDPWLIISFSLVAGLALGLVSAVTSEFSRNCFRNVNEIGRVLMAPVLGNVQSIVTRAEARRRSLVRYSVGAAGLLVILGLNWFTWAWAKQPELLAPDLRQRIEQVREVFR